MENLNLLHLKKIKFVDAFHLLKLKNRTFSCEDNMRKFTVM